MRTVKRPTQNSIQNATYWFVRLETYDFMEYLIMYNVYSQWSTG
jgi:hypothetical protein